MSTTRGVRGENRLYMAPPMRKLQQEREKKRKRLEAEEEKGKAKKFSEDLLITNSSKSVREYSDLIPADLLIDIFSRVPAKSIGRFRYVSKFWKSILGRPDFTELFLTKSVARPRLLFAFKVNEELLVFSSPQPQSPNNNSSLVATRYKYLPKHFQAGILGICKPLCGLVSLQSRGRKPRIICNPVTGEFITLRSLPKVRAKRIMGNYFGFDPINKQLKVLCMTWSCYGTPTTHWVLTLGTRKRKWRTIQDPVFPHFAKCDGICKNGVLYYKANFEESYKIVCFDFRFEKFSIINMDEDMLNDRYSLTLFNNQGKLGACLYTCYRYEGFTLWVLEDAGKHKWSKRICVVPRTVEYKKFVGMTGTGEIVFTPYILSKHFYIFYYNIERNTLTRVNIKGFEGFKDHPAIFLDYVESMKFM